MSDQFPVETRYGVIWQGHIHDIFDCIEDAVEEAARCVHFEKKLGSAKVIDLEVRPLRQEPCKEEWRLDLNIMTDPIRDVPWRYCPLCGRRLEAK